MSFEDTASDGISEDIARLERSGSRLVLGALYMLGARSRAKIECFKMHIRPKVRTFIEIWIFYS